MLTDVIVSAILGVLIGICLFGILDVERQIEQDKSKK